MTTAVAIQSVRFWTDQFDTWFNDDEVVLAINRAVGEWVQRKYELGISTERDEADLIGLLPPPIVKSGNRILLGIEPILYVLAVTVQYRNQDGGLSEEAAARPLRADRIATSKNSLFHRPTASYPLYQRTTDPLNGLTIDVLSGNATVDTARVYTLKKPLVLEAAKPSVDWNQFSDPVQQEIIQIAKRMLLAAKLPDYQTQVQAESPMATGLPIN